MLRTLTETADPEQFLTIWSLPSKKAAHYHASPQGSDRAMEDAIARAKKGEDVYVSVGLKATPPQRGRGTRLEVTSLLGFFADLDVGKEGAFESKDAAISAAITWSPAPTLIVDSGGGIHAWWLFDEPTHITDGDARADIEQQMARWILWFARQTNTTLDPVGDSARVLRVAAPRDYPHPSPFLNHKTDPPRVCQVVKDDGPRHSLSDLIDAIPDDVESQPFAGSPSEVDIDDVVVNLKPNIRARLDEDMVHPVNGLLNANDSLRRLFKKERADLQGDASRYCYHVALNLYEAGGTDQQVVDAMIYWRQLHNAKDKPHDWFRKCAASAYTYFLQNCVESPAEASPDKKPKNHGVKPLRAITGAPVVQIVKDYVPGVKRNRMISVTMVFADGRKITLAPAHRITDQRFVANQIFNSVEVVVRPVKPEVWREAVSAAMSQAETNLVDDDAGLEQAMVEVFKRMLDPIRGRSIFLQRREGIKAEALERGDWIVIETANELLVSYSAVKEAMTGCHGDFKTTTDAEFANFLKEVGGTPARVRVGDEGKRIRCWKFEIGGLL
jgi:hypothetical protein